MLWLGTLSPMREVLPALAIVATMQQRSQMGPSFLQGRIVPARKTPWSACLLQLTSPLGTGLPASVIDDVNLAKYRQAGTFSILLDWTAARRCSADNEIHLQSTSSPASMRWSVPAISASSMFDGLQNRHVICATMRQKA